MKNAEGKQHVETVNLGGPAKLPRRKWDPNAPIELTGKTIKLLKIVPPADGHLDHLVPKRLIPAKASFEIAGINNTIANGLRRTLALEIQVKSLTFEFDDFKTNNDFTIIDMIQTRVRLIPIDQSTSLSLVLSLDVHNDGMDLLEVYGRDIKGTKTLPFNDTFVLMTLEPGKFIKIDRITVAQGYGKDFAGFSVAFNDAALALDQWPINPFRPEKGGIPSSLSDPRHYAVNFTTNGTMPPEEIMKAACDSITERLTDYREMLDKIETTGDYSTLTTLGTGDTIGNLLMRAILDIEPDIPAVTYSTDQANNGMTLKIRGATHPDKLVSSAIDYLVEKFAVIANLF